jgi:hypothetical protein
MEIKIKQQFFKYLNLIAADSGNVPNALVLDGVLGKPYKQKS